MATAMLVTKLPYIHLHGGLGEEQKGAKNGIKVEMSGRDGDRERK